MYKHYILILALVFGFAAASPMLAQAADAPPQIVVGKDDAPVTVVEYASLTCGHCASFHQQHWPNVKEKLVDTGKVRWIFRDFPLDGPALQGALMVHCMPAAQREAMLKVLFENQQRWARGADARMALLQYGQLAGLSADAANACLDNSKMKEQIIKGRVEAGEKLNVASTPTFIFNDGAERLTGARPVEEFQKLVDKLAK